MKNNNHKKNVITDYCIIDHIGAIEEGDAFVKELYKKAYSLSQCKKTFKIKEMCKIINPYVSNIKGMKNSIRQSKTPAQVIVICTNLSTADWTIRQWLERVNNVTIIHVPDGCAPYEVITAEEFDPTIFQTWETPESKARRCAAIWAKALDYEFNAPLYRDSTWAMDEGFMERPDKDIQKELGNHSCKISTKPEKFRITKAVASEAEIKQFWEYYKYLYMNKLLEEFISSDYHLCPHCGRPIHQNTESCQWCDTTNEFFIEEFKSYYDTEELDEDQR